MEIKNAINTYRKGTSAKKRWKRWAFFLVLIGMVVAGTIASKMLKKKGYSGLFDFCTTVLSNYKNSWDAQPEEMAIEIKSNDFKKLEKHRKNALERRVIVNDLDGEYVDGIIHYNGKKITVKLRLKGHMTDHLQDDKWSFRIKIKEKDETFMGMKRFTIQHPGTRGYIYEWIYHELMKQEDIIALRYKFINVKVNGEDWGIYAVEENFENELVENNNRLKGPVLRFNPDLYWVNRYTSLNNISSVDEFASYYSANPEAYREDKVLSDSIQKQYYLKAIALIEGLRAGKIKVDQAFDIPRLAKFHAIIDLVGGVHSIDWSDIKYYYNPVTSKLEPVAYESFTILGSKELSAQYMYVNLDSTQNYSEWHEMIFSNPTFFKEYMKQLERVSKPAYLDAFFAASNTALKENLAIIHKEFPYKKFDKNDYYKRQKQILRILNPPKALHAYFNKIEDTIVSLQIASIDALPVQIHSIELDGVKAKPITEIILPAKAHHEALSYRDYQFNIGTTVLKKDWMDSLRINYSILGASEIKQTKVFPFPHTDSEFIAQELKMQQSNVSDFPFLKIDEVKKTITISPGTQQIDKDLILPAGYTVLAKSPCAIDLRKNAKIVSYSNFVFNGLEDESIVISSSDSSSQGIVFIGCLKSVFKNVVFRNFAKVKDAQWKRSGAITFYESAVDFKNCSFYNFKSEDAVNVIRSPFSMEGCLFQNMKDDAFDADFSNGKIEKCAFENCKENAIDITKTQVQLNTIFIKGTNNKGLNCKDGSLVNGTDIKITDAYIAISAEDFSKIDLKRVSVSNSEIGIVAYKNKPSAGYATVVMNDVTFTNVKNNFLKEKKSTMSINNKDITEDIEDVELIIKKNGKKK
jgi:hypothetical protein